MDQLESEGTAQRVVPDRMAHFVVRTNKYEAMVDWYRTVFQADTIFSDAILTFLSFDEEHHRLALVNMPELADGSDEHTAIDHVAFTYSTLDDLLNTYTRLRDTGIMPEHTLNHGPTTSFYYADPNGNKIELQVDNFPTLVEARDYFSSEAFANNAIGDLVDPEKLISLREANVPVFEILRPGGVAVA